MKRQRKRFFNWCPQPQGPNYRVLRQYSKPILSLVMVGIIAISIFAVSTLALNHAPTPPPITLPTATPIPTPTATPMMQPTATPKPSASPTPMPTFLPTPNPSPTATLTPTYHVPNGTVDSQGFVAYSSLALDSSNNPHMSYYDSYHDALKYAIYNSTSWNLQTVDIATVSSASRGEIVCNSSSFRATHIHRRWVKLYWLKFKPSSHILISTPWHRSRQFYNQCCGRHQ